MTDVDRQREQLVTSICAALARLARMHETDAIWFRAAAGRAGFCGRNSACAWVKFCVTLPTRSTAASAKRCQPNMIVGSWMRWPKPRGGLWPITSRTCRGVSPSSKRRQTVRANRVGILRRMVRSEKTEGGMALYKFV
jgi:hypothetical protein